MSGLSAAGLALIVGTLLTADAGLAVMGPTGASSVKRALLGLEGLRAIDVQAAEVHLRFADGGALTLRHPGENAPGPRTTAAFQVAGEAAPARLAALVQRLAAVPREAVWREAQREEVQPTRAPGPDGVDVEAALLAAQYDLRIGELARARDRFDALAKDARTLERMGPDLSQGLWRAGDGQRAAAVAEAWLAGSRVAAGPSSELRAKVLAGAVTDGAATASALDALGVDASCHVGMLARDLDAVGQREAGYALLSATWPAGGAPTACPTGPALRVEWLTMERRFDEALPLSAELLARDAAAAPYQSVRALLLLAVNKPLEAIPLLESLARGQSEADRAGAIRSLLGAYLRVPDEAYKTDLRARLLQEYRDDPEALLSGFLGGILLHYDQQFEASTQVLTTLVGRVRGQPRLYIYLAMNAFNLLQPGRALALLEDAAREAPEAGDPDVHYCRAEILRWHDPPAALRELDYYLALTAGSPTAGDHKRRRVQTMRDALDVCVASGADAPCDGPWEHPRGYERTLHDLRGLGATTDTSGGGPTSLQLIASLAVGLVLLGLAWLFARRRRSIRG